MRDALNVRGVVLTRRLHTSFDIAGAGCASVEACRRAVFAAFALLLITCAKATAVTSQ